MARVAIIGAGLAGLNAARTLLEHGIAVELFEATDRIGGRAHTAYHPDAQLPIELGPEFVHGDPDHTRELVRDPTIEIDEFRERHYLRHAGQVQPAGDVWKKFNDLLADVDEKHDESASAFLTRVRMSHADARLFAGFVEGFYGADLDDISIRSVADDAGGAGGGADEAPSHYQIRGGYGRVIGAIASRTGRADLHLGCVVRHIDWHERPVVIDYQRGARHRKATADFVIVTVPLGVLHAGMIRFTPQPDPYTRALAKLAMGQVVKVVFRLREPVWSEHAGDGITFVHGGEGFPTYWVRSRGDTHLLTAWAGGASARELGNRSRTMLIERAVRGFATTAGVDLSRLARAVLDEHFYDYGHDPFARGAYSYARVGAGEAAGELAKPLAERLYLAGEATDLEYEGTVAGALASGQRAADAIVRFLGATHNKRAA